MSLYLQTKDYTAMRGPCPEGFHVPTYDDWDRVIPYSSINFMEYYHMPPGFEFSSTSLSVYEKTSSSDYWACDKMTMQSSWGSTAQILRIYASWWSNHYPASIVQASHIRPFKDEVVHPDSTWTLEYEEEDECYIYHNATLWLITVYIDTAREGKIRTTMADKNLWATVLYNYWDTQSTSNCGYIYQPWNNYWFDPQWTITKSNTVVNCTWYWPGNYYSSNLMKTTNWNTTNEDMWWWETWVLPVSAELKSAYIGDWLNAWIYHNASLWLITFKKWAYKYTFADKNLWATSTDVTSSASYWYYFQFWNNHWRTSRPSSRSASQIDWSSYWPWNYYNSSTFHTVSDWNNPTLWDSSWNLNLWWDTTNTYEARQWPCPSWWHIPSWTEVYDIFWEIWNRHNIKTKEWFRQCLLMPQPWWLAYNDWTVIDVWDVWVWMTTQRWWISWSHIWRFHSVWWDWTVSSAGYWWRTNCWNTAQIRPFKNGYVEPDETWTLLLDMS